MLSLRKFVIAFALLGGAQAFAPASSRSILARRGARPSGKKAPLQMGFDMEASIQKTKDMRLQHLEEQAMLALELAIENHDHPVFPNAMIAGDCVITHLLHRMGYLENGKVKVMVVDTLHLFPETMEFLADIEKEYNFKAEVFLAEGCKDKEEYDTKYGADLWKEDIEQYDKVCKVEPFQRGLKTCETDVMINGRTRWQGFERAYIDLFENAPIGGGLAKVNPIAYWTFEDTFDYIAKYKVSAHPLHAKGYPSIGDAKDTIPIPEDGTTMFKDFKFEGDKTAWLDYASERKGRFVGLVNKDGSTKTECGIHVEGAEKTFDRDLWDSDSKVVTLDQEGALALKSGDDASVMVTYAPWCQFCQAMEDEYEKLAAKLGAKGITVAKYRGDEDRDFVSAEFDVKSFPTITAFKGGKMTKYDSEERSVEKLTEFVESV
jgi:phosphoadenylyl-sulfate reductase (thioredoxin)